jgi:hypothetical protein
VDTQRRIWNVKLGCGHVISRTFSNAVGEKLFNVRWHEGIVVKSNLGGECPECLETSIASARDIAIRLVRKAVAS